MSTVSRFRYRESRIARPTAAPDQLAVEVAGEGHQIEVDGVEHQLDAHQHPHGVSAVDQAPDAGAEQQCGHRQEGLQRNGGVDAHGAVS
jgi:hypothetical protein